MDSSNDSFAWTDASSDSSIMTPEIEHDESGLDYKRKIQKELFDDQPTSGKTKKKKRKASEMQDSSPVNNNKSVKTEPESDIEPQNKKKKRNNTLSDDRLEPSQDTLMAEDYLNLRVKQEQLSFAEPEPVKKKKKKHKKEKETEFETQDSESKETLRVENESEINNMDNSLNNFDKTIVETEKFEAEDTIVQKNKKKSIKTEPESDIEPQNKKKKRNNTLSDDRLEPSQDTLMAEDYLNLRVKQEQLSFAEPEPVKKKKKKHKKEKETEFETQDSESTETLRVENESEINYIDNSLNNFDKIIVEKEKFEAEETIVQKKKKKRKQEPKCSTSELEESLEINSSENISSENVREIEKPIITNGLVESDSDFEPIKTYIKLAPEAKSKTKSTKSNNESPNKKSTRITDRLTFEDEESLESEKSSTTSNRLQQFVNINSKLKVCVPSIDKENIITDDDEVWIFRIPKDVDIKNLKDSKFTLDAKWKIKINGQSYDGAIENNLSQIPLLFYNKNKCQIKNMPLMGEVSLRKRIPKAHIPQETCMINNQTNFIPLPETKSRHPLFGINYKKAIEVPRTIAERLNGNIENDTALESFSGKKEKKKHKKEKKEIEKESEPEGDVEELQSPNPKKKKRKRKHSETVEDTSTAKSKKSKRAKLEPDSAEAWESERAIEANLFNF